MVNLITEHIDVWTAAKIQKSNGGRGRGANSNGQSVYGIKKLRELILELAVRGKLVPQEPKDEPASALLKKIAKEKQQLVKEGKIKKQKPLPEISEDEKPFELPKGWEWVKLGNIAEVNGGFAFKSAKYSNDGVRVVRISDFDEKGFKNDKIVRYPFSDDLNSFRLEAENILMAMTGGTVGKSLLVKILPEPMVVNQRVATIKIMDRVIPEYINSLIRTDLIQNLIQEAKNSTNDNISMGDITGFLMPLPPISEQHRIVAKVDELMALCDQLEQQQIESSDTHQTLVETLLATLTNAADQKECAKAWQRIADQFDILFTTEHSIEHLKQTILQLAVMGKLVPQDPNDLPAPRPGKWFVYVLECEDGSLYKGHSQDILKRWKQHASGEGSEWTKKHPPKRLVHWEAFNSQEEAVAREKELKSGYGRKWLEREIKAGRTRRAGGPGGGGFV
jgi:type I restriction enzyme S subunit